MIFYQKFSVFFLLLLLIKPTFVIYNILYTHEVVRKFLSDELEMENAADIEFQRAHRQGKKKTGETRPGIVRFLRFPERELVFRRVRELADDIDIKGFKNTIYNSCRFKKQLI